MTQGKPFEVLRIFLGLGLTSFGGPVAHLGYFRREFVERRAWLPAQDYASLLALCQLLPGPASSQVGFAIGLRRAGWAGGAAAWLGFTLPSAVLMTALALGLPALSRHPLWAGALHGLGLAAIAIVAQAVWQLARTLCPDAQHRAIALLASVLVLAIPGSFGQLLAIGMGLAAGRLIPAPAAPPATAGPAVLAHRGPLICLTLFTVLLLLSCLISARAPGGLAAAFYRTGALVFGGGHVVLPLLRGALVTPGLITAQRFLDGYGAAQAMPGPLFSVAAFLGAAIAGNWPGAAVATAAIFLPGLLLVGAAMPYWERLRHHAGLKSALGGANAAVVGLLGASLIGLVILSAPGRPTDIIVALAALLLLTAGRVPPVLVVTACAAAGALFAAL
jgi:chromate transporter